MRTEKEIRKELDISRMSRIKLDISRSGCDKNECL